MILAVVNDGCFSIGGVPYRKGHLFPLLYPDAGKVEFRREIAPGYTLIDPTHYSDFIDGSTGNPFASYSALIAWIELYLFPSMGVGGSTLPFMKWIYVKAAPVAEDEVAAGNTITHSFLNTGVLKAMYIDGVLHGPDTFVHTPGQVQKVAGNFNVNTQILMLKTLS